MRTHNIERLLFTLNKSLFTINDTLSYDRVIDGLIALANTVHQFCDENPDYDESLWYLGESSYCDLSSLIIGAYWHFTEWHAGQYSKSYAALCALGQVFSPGMTSSPEPDSPEVDAYEALNSMAEQSREVSKHG